jgi:hypothetical protein
MEVRQVVAGAVPAFECVFLELAQAVGTNQLFFELPVSRRSVRREDCALLQSSMDGVGPGFRPPMHRRRSPVPWSGLASRCSLVGRPLHEREEILIGRRALSYDMKTIRRTMSL